MPNALPGGDSLFEIMFGGSSYFLHAGEEFKFTDYNANGVSDFKLLGIDLAEGIDPNGLPPFVAGFKYTSEGVVTLYQAPIIQQVDSTATPEPATLAIWGLGALGCVFAGYRRRKST